MVKHKKGQPAVQAVTQAELAREIGCSRSRICELVREGLLLTDRLAALRWIATNTSGYSGGWELGQRGKPSLHERAELLLDGKPITAPDPEAESDVDEVLATLRDGDITAVESALLDRVRAQASLLLPDLARRLGLPEHVVVCAHEIFDSLLANTGADQNYSDLDAPNSYTWPAFDSAVARASDEVEAAADAFMDHVELLFDQIEKPQK